MMSLWDALRMNMMISYQELVRTFPRTMPGNIAWFIASPISAQPFNTRKTDNNAQGNDIIIAIINA